MQSLTRLFAAVGYAPGTVRLMLSRSVKDGSFIREKSGKAVFYSPQAATALDISSIGAWAFIKGYEPVWDDRWFMVTYQIPDERRELRERLRTRLTRHGFGRLGFSLWLAPFDREALISELGQELEIADLLMTFRGEVTNLLPEEIATRAWNLPAIADQYRQLMEVFARIERALPSHPSDEQAFAAIWEACLNFVMTVQEDPRLPTRLLPVNWPGQKAAQYYKRLEERWYAPAMRFFDQVAVYYGSSR